MAKRTSSLWQGLGRIVRVVTNSVDTGKSVAQEYLRVKQDLHRHALQLPLLSLGLLLPKPKWVPKAADGFARPVLFVHGYGGQPGQFLGMRSWFKARGRTRCYTMAFTGKASLESWAMQLAKTIDWLAEAHGDLGVDIVAHSMGGLVVRMALCEEILRERVKSLITLGTPHRGTQLARIVENDFTKAMRPESEFVAFLQEQTDKFRAPDYPRLVTLWSRSDLVVRPSFSAAIPELRAVEMVGFTHYSYLLNPQGWRRVFELLLET